MKSTLTIARGFKALLLAGGASTIVLATPAFAQDKVDCNANPNDPSCTSANPIIVTGTRIQTKDFSSNSPIVTVNDQFLKDSSTAAIEDNLNQLPQFVPAKTPTGGFDIQPTATNTPGSATVSLRGLGANRNLVLIDGRRATPGNAAMIVDINTIPSAAVERIETITGGASATYGADAVAGVTNFILKKNYQGLDLDAQMGLTEHGDGFEYQISGIMGSDFADGRGNISVAMSYNKRNATYQKDRSWYQDLWKNPSVGGNVFFIRYPGVAFSAFNPASQTALQSVFPGTDTVSAPPTIFAPNSDSIVFPFGVVGYNVYTNPDGQPFTGAGFPFGRFQQGGLVDTGNGFGLEALGSDPQYKQDATGALAASYTDAYQTLPLERYNILARGNYEINDWIGVFGQAMFSKVSTETKNQGGALVSGWDVYVPYGTDIYHGNADRGIPDSLNGDGSTNAAYLAGGQYGLDCPVNGGCPTYQVFPVPAALQTLLLSRPDPNAPISLQYGFDPPRTTLTDVNTFNMLAGFQGSIPMTDWTWELYVNHGESATYARQTGTFSIARTRWLLQSPNYGYGFSWGSNAESDRNQFGANFATCTTGMDIFTTSWANVSQDCKDAINADLKNRSVIKQTIFEFNAQGKLADLPAGELRAAIGADYMKVNYEFRNDTITTQGSSFLDQSIGIYPSADSTGHITTKEIYGELAIPLFHDVPGVQSFSLELGGRISDYNTTGTSYTYKALADWTVVDWLRFRGGYNRAVRAPNIAELYLAPQQTFAVNSIGDICSEQSNYKVSANPAASSDAADIKAVCTAIMDATGGAGTGAAYYARPPANQPAPGAGFAFPTLIGNPNLQPEVADTWTAGAVIQSPSPSPWVSGLSLSVDWYNIKVKKAIGYSVGSTLQTCLDPYYNSNVTGAAGDPAKAQAAAAAFACQGVRYDPPPLLGLGNVTMSYTNDGYIDISGIDANLNWRWNVGPGTLNLNVQGSYFLHYRVTELAANAPADYAGTFGTTSAGLNPGAYRWRTFTTLGYSMDKWRLAVTWQHLPSVEDSGEALGHTTTLGAPAYNLFGLNASYNLFDNLKIRAGVQNLFNKAPPLTNVNPANTSPATTGQLPGGSFNTGFYDDNGRRFFLGANVKF